MNILIFGPNGSGKGTQGAIVQKKYNLPHIESGVIFRENISNGTELGNKAKEYIDRGDLVPDDITIPMILNRLNQDDCKNGWLLDGFPRNVTQAEELYNTMRKEHMDIDCVIEIVLDRETAKNRIMGRRLCENDNNHPNNVFIDAIKPAEENSSIICRVCGGALKTRSDDQDEAAIDKRHNIYYDDNIGTIASVGFFKKLSREAGGKPKIIEVNGKPGVEEVSAELMSKLG